MANSVDWKIHSMESLSLFGQVTLDSGQVKALPASIREKIFKGYSDLLNDPSMPQFAGNRMRFTAKTTVDGNVFVSYDGGKSFQSAGSLKEFPKLLSAMREAYDVARVQFPTAFREAKSIEPMKTDPVTPRSRLGEVRAIALDLNSLARNSCSAGGVATSFIPFSGLAAAGLGLWGASDIALREKKKYDRASTIGDEEGKTQAAIDGAEGVSYGMLNFGMLGAYLPSAYDALPGVSASQSFRDVGHGFGFAAEGIAIGMGLFLAASALHEWQFISAFRNDFKRILKRDISQQKKAIEGLEFLQQQISLTAKDWGELSDKGLDRDPTAIRNKCEEKYDRFVRRVGAQVVENIAKSANLLTRLKEGKDLDALQEAKDLIELADQESFKKRVKDITLFVLAALMIVMGPILAFTTAGIAIPIAFAISAGLWLTIDSRFLHDKIGGAVYKIFKPSEEARWANSVEKEDFLEKILKTFVKDGKWNLKRLKRDIEGDLDRSDFYLNGKPLKKFEDCMRKLGLQGLDFTAEGLEERELTDKQKKGLRFLAMLNQGIVASSFEALVKEHEDKKYVMEVKKRLNLEAHYNLDTGVGTIKACKPFDITKEYDVESPIDFQVEAHMEVDGSHYRIWTRVV